MYYLHYDSYNITMLKSINYVEDYERPELGRQSTSRMRSLERAAVYTLETGFYITSKLLEIFAKRACVSDLIFGTPAHDVDQQQGATAAGNPTA